MTIKEFIRRNIRIIRDERDKFRRDKSIRDEMFGMEAAVALDPDALEVIWNGKELEE